MRITDYTKEPTLQRAQIRIALDSTNVSRLHTFGITDYNVGMHTVNMMHLLSYLWPDPEIPTELVKAVLEHDIPEAVTGDIPNPAKNAWCGIRGGVDEAERDIQKAFRHDGSDVDCTEEHHTWLRALDRLELYLWALERWVQGDRRQGMRLLIQDCRDTLLFDTQPEAMADFVFDVTLSSGAGWAGMPGAEIAGI